MPDTPATSGADLARQALARARAAAKTAPTTKPRGLKRSRRAPGAGRDPQPLAGILGTLATDEGWTDNLGGGRILDRWPTLCPTTYAQTTRPTGYDPDTGTLAVQAVSHTVASGLRMMEPQLVVHLNRQLGRTVVRRLRVGVAGGPTPELMEQAPQPRPEAPVKTRETAHPGYRAALEATLTHRPDRQPADPYMAEALARQEAALRANRLPDTEHTEAAWEYDRLTTARDDEAEQVRRAAIARARHERANTGSTPSRLFGAA